MDLIEVVTVSDARANLSRILADLGEAGSAADPVFIGAHRKAEGVLLSVDAYKGLAGELAALRERFARSEDVASAWGSLEAEGLKPSADFKADADAYVHGLADIDDLVRRAIERYRASDDESGVEAP